MFSTLDVVGIAVRTALTHAREDRERYAPFFAAGEAFIARRGLIVGGGAASRLLLGEGPTPEDYHYELYSDQAEADAQDLCDALYQVAPEGLGRYTHCTSRVPALEFSVIVDERELFYVRALPIHRKVRTVDVVVPSLRPASFTGPAGASAPPVELQCMGPEIMLMELYAGLSDPARAGEWEELISTERRLRGLFLEEVGGKIERAVAPVGGAAPDPLTKLLVQEFLPGAGRVLTGARGAQLAAGEPLRRGDRLQIVTTNELEHEEREIKRLAAAHRLSVRSTPGDPKIPTDPRVKRLTFHLEGRGAEGRGAGGPGAGGRGGSAPVVDLFFLGGLVPFRRVRPAGRGGRPLRVAAPPVSLRVKLVDFWVIQLLFRIKSTTARYTEEVLTAIVRGYRREAEAYDQALARDWREVFPSEADDYAGAYLDPGLAKKRQVHQDFQKGRRRGAAPPYYPAASR